MRLYAIGFGCVAFVSAVAPFLASTPQNSAPVVSPMTDGPKLPNFVSAARFAAFDTASKAADLGSDARAAAETLSAKFSAPDRADIELLKISEARDAGPLASASSDAIPLPTVEVADLGDDAVSSAKVPLIERVVVSHASRMYRVSAPNQRHKSKRRSAKAAASILALATGTAGSPKGGRPNEAHDESLPEAIASTMQPLLSRCGKMTPACLANQAWCGC